MLCHRLPELRLHGVSSLSVPSSKCDSSTSSPTGHIDDPKQVVGTRGWFILKVLTVILVLVAVVGGVIYIVYSRKQQQAKKRFY